MMQECNEQKDTANPLSHHVIASLNRVNLVKAFAPELVKIVTCKSVNLEYSATQACSLSSILSQQRLAGKTENYNLIITAAVIISQHRKRTMKGDC